MSPETNIFTPENGWLEWMNFLLGPGPISGGKMAVSFRECMFFSTLKMSSFDVHILHTQRGDYPTNYDSLSQAGQLLNFWGLYIPVFV